MRAHPLLVSLLPAIVWQSGVHVSHAEEINPKVGAATVSITPTVGTPMAGYYFERKSEGVHDDLFAKAIVFDHGGVRAALVSLDLISTSSGMVEDARAEIERITKVPGRNVMISATHAHTGPILTGRGSRDAEFGGKNPLTQAYNAELPRRIAEAVRNAEANLTKAQILAARGKETGIAFNRRFHMKDGTVGWNPGKLNPKILKPAGPIDPDVDLVFIKSAANDQTPLATYVNHAVHLDNVGGVQFSADMPATVSRLLGEVMGSGMLTCYTSGCCGDINHINVKWAEPQKGFENAERMGIILAGTVLKTWPNLRPITLGPLAVKSTTVLLPIPTVTPDEIARATEIVERHRSQTKNPPSFLDAVWGYRVLDTEARHGKPIPVEVQVIALGTELAWVSLPGEIFVELGLAIKQDSPFKQTTIAELANGAIGYIPTRRAYSQGNYEVVSARCAEGSGEMLVDAAIKLLKQIYAENSAARSATR
jgi:hypothetical protein